MPLQMFLRIFFVSEDRSINFCNYKMCSLWRKILKYIVKNFISTGFNSVLTYSTCPCTSPVSEPNIEGYLLLSLLHLFYV